MKNFSAVRVVAVVEAFKGLVVVAAGFELLSLIHQNIQMVAESIISHLHLNPSREIPRIFLRYSAELNSQDLQQMAALALLYSAGRLIEAYGLWFERKWAEWMAIVTAAIYVPFELVGIWEGKVVEGAIALAINLIVLLIMTRALWRRSRAEC